MKTQKCLKEVEVTAARKIAAGFLLLQFGRNTDPTKIAEVRSAIAEVMGKEAAVNAATRRLTVQVSDMDPITTKEEVQAAFNLAIA